MTLKAGQGLGVIGPSAAGKSTLARAIIGLWPLARGSVRLDGATLDRWSVEALGGHIGYLPQDVELFEGSIAENIGRFEEDANGSLIIAAARAAGVHDMILRLPNGYETQVGPRARPFRPASASGSRLPARFTATLSSSCWTSRIRTSMRKAKPRSRTAIQGVRARGGIVVVIAQRPSALNAVDHIAVVGAGQIQAFDSKDKVLRKAMRRPLSSVS